MKPTTLALALAFCLASPPLCLAQTQPIQPCPPNTINNTVCYNSYNCFSRKALPLCKTISVCISKCIDVPPPRSTVPTLMRPIVDEHNRVRKLHHAAPLQWDATIAKTAQAWANKCKFDHDPHSNYGENLMWAPHTNQTKALADAANLWYSEVNAYNFAIQTNPLSTYHFTQMVWKATQYIGCAVASCPTRPTSSSRSLPLLQSWECRGTVH